MGKVIVSEFMTVDGVIQDPGGAEGIGGWSFQFNRGPEGDKIKLGEVMEAEALLLGRVTYEGFAQAWPGMTDGAGFADKMNGMPKYVVSATLQTAAWGNTTILAGDLVKEVTALKERLDGDLLVLGSGRLVSALASHGLVDIYRLMIFPIAVGTGDRLFSDTGHPVTLSLASTEPVGPDGVVVMTYTPAQ